MTGFHPSYEDAGRCILIGDEKLTYDGAVAYCTQAASNLVDNVDEVVALLGLQKRLGTTFWLRANQIEGHGRRCRSLFLGNLNNADCKLQFRPLCELDKDIRLPEYTTVVSETVDITQATASPLQEEHFLRLDRSYNSLKYLLESYDTSFEVETAVYLSLLAVALSSMSTVLLVVMLTRNWKRSGGTSFADANKGKTLPRGDDSRAPTAVPSFCCICS